MPEEKTLRTSSHANKRERGYTLMALLVAMALVAISLTATAPVMRQAAQREREREAIRRGEEIAEAIRVYVRRRGVLPTSMDQLVEGIPLGGTRKLQLLRASAARDPLTEDGEWELIPPTDPAVARFVRSVTTYAGNRAPVTRDQHQLLQQLHQTIIGAANLGGGQIAGQGGSVGATGSFIGVASRSERASVITYYGIERHDEWIFTPLFR
jgi:type II secretory pathway pseudopilin PulG